MILFLITTSFQIDIKDKSEWKTEIEEEWTGLLKEKFWQGLFIKK